MSTTTIKTNATEEPVYAGDELYVDTDNFGGDDGDTVNLCITHGEDGKRAGIFVSRAELLAALDAAPKRNDGSPA